MNESLSLCLFFFNDTATTEIYTLSLHDALPISTFAIASTTIARTVDATMPIRMAPCTRRTTSTIVNSRPSTNTSAGQDRKSTRLNSSHANISYAVFCLKKKKISILIHLQVHDNV